MSKSIHQLIVASVIPIAFFGCAGGLQAGCSTAANVTTCTPANGQLVFDNSSAKFIPYGTGVSTILVSGVGGPVTAVAVTLNAVVGTGGTPLRAQHTWAMLVAPNGTTNLVFFGRPCNGSGTGHRNFAGQTFTVADNGTATFPGGTSTSPNCDTLAASPPSYKPITDDGAGNISFPSPAPTPTYAAPGPPATNATFASQFTGITGNGTWTLYAAGLSGTSETGAIGAGSGSPAWSIDVTFTSAMATNTTVVSNLNPSFTSGASSLVTLTSSVTSGSAVNGGTVTFKDGTNAISCSGGSQTVSNGTATCQFTFLTEGAHIITAQYGGNGSFAGSNSSAITQVVNRHTINQVSPPAGTVGFCNTGAITIPQTGSNGDPTATPASPYASEIFVTGQSGIIQNLQVYLNGFTSSEPFAEGFMLVSPGGKALDFLSQAGGGMPFNNFNFIIADSGAIQMPDASAPSNNTTYKPSSYTNSSTTYCQSAVCNGVTVSEPAPSVFDSAAPRGSKTMLGEFGGLGANGTWQLFVVDRQPLQTGSVSGGWCINFTLAVGAHPTTTTLMSSLNPSFLSDPVTFTATVVNQDTPNGQINEGTVTFLDGLTNIGSGNVTFNGTANVATSTTSNPLVLNERTHPISATYNGTSNFGFSSSNTVQQVVNRHSLVTASGNVYSYCNKGPVTVPAAGAANALQGVARPYPSNIFVASLPGVTNKVTPSLNNYTSNLPSDFASLLVGPGGGPTFAFDFFSRVGGINCVGDPNCVGGTGFNGDNLTFQDGSGTVPTLSSGQTLTVGMNSGPGANTWPAPAPASFLYAAPQGSAVLSAFNNQNNNGTWSLYMQNLVNGAFGGIGDNVNPANPSLNAWCVNLTQTPPVLAIAKSHTAPSFVQGQTGAYTLTVTNNGPGPTGDPTGMNPVTVTDVLTSAPGLSVTAMSGTGWTCTTLPICTRNDALGPNLSYPPITVSVNVAGNAATPQVNKASVLGGGSVGTVTTTPGDSTVILPAPVLSVTKTHAGTFTQGQTGGEWDVLVSNAAGSGGTAGTTTVSDTLPLNYTVHDFSTTSASWSCSGAGTQTATCTSTLVVAGGSSFPAVQIIVNVPATSPVSVTNTGKAFGGDDQTHTTLPSAAMGSDTVNNVVQVPASIAVTSGNNQNVLVNTAYAALKAIVKDAANVVIPGAGVTFTANVGGTGATGNFAAAPPMPVATDAGGIATAPTFTANGSSGPFTVTASIAALNAPFSARNIVSTPPTADSVTGIAPGSLNQTLTFKYSSVNGFGYLNFNYALFNSSLNGTGACWPFYDQTTNKFFLAGDGVTAKQGPLTPGSAGTISNAQCSLNGTGSSVSGAGNTLTVVFNLTFTAGFGPSHTIYMSVLDAGNLNSGWQTKGTTAGSNTPPTADSVAGVTPGSLTQPSLVFKYSSANGAAYLMDTYALFNGSLNGVNACWVFFDRTANGFYLVNDAQTGLLGPLAQNAAGTLANSQCTLNGTGSTISQAGNTLTMNLNVTFTAGFGAAQSVFMYAGDAGGQNSGWQSKGTTGTASAPTSDSVTGIATGALAQTLTFKYSSANGTKYLNDVHALFSATLNGVNACWIFYDKGVDGWYLINDAASSYLGPLPRGSTATLNNSQCTLNGTGSTVTGAGNTLTMVLNVTFSAAFGAGQNIFLYASDEAGQNSGWVNKGTTASSVKPTADSVTGMLNGSAAQSLVFKYSSVNGANYLGNALALVNTGLGGTGACWVFYDKPADSFYLANDAGSAYLGPLARGSSGTLVNSQCTLNGTGSTVSTLGNTLTLTLSLTISGLHGDQSIFMYASDAGGMTSDWQPRGTVRLP